ncbi:hypothetical protein EDD85DRAFT_70993 [Armillaria nabsnona]|nr:hypothetical protein EDD85DRAFT_70993 [Armillaria nabsnona]
MQVYIKPRPISHKYGHSNYLTFKYPFDINYGPFFVDYGTIPSDATKVYTVRPSSPLSASLSKLYNELLPSFDADVPDPNKFPRSAWHGILQLAVAKVDSSFFFQLECEDHIVRLVKGDCAPAPPPTSRRTADLSPEWYNVVYGTLLRGEVEVCDESWDTELELFIWAYLYSEANEQVHIWRGLRREMLQLTRPFFAAHLPSAYTDNSGLLKAASAIVSVFAIKTPIDLTPSSMDENKPPLLCPSSSSSHAGDVDTDDDNRDRPFRRRNRIVSSDTADL